MRDVQHIVTLWLIGWSYTVYVCRTDFESCLDGR